MPGQLGNYTWVETQDLSPSLHLGVGGEWMHSSGGALQESLYIYGEAISEALGRGWTSFVSVGLGLGYNELLVFAEALRRDLNHRRLILRSFEADPFLVNAFLQALKEGASGEGVSEPVYQKIFELLKEHFEFSTAELQVLFTAMIRAHQDQRWEISGSLNQHTTWSQSYHCFLYDAFSAKSCPELWEEEFLRKLLEQAADHEGIFSTYACTGALKRALKMSGYEVEVRKGFHVKKQSTLARRLSLPKA